MKHYVCPYCGREMLDDDFSIRFKCRYCKREVNGWEEEFHEKIKDALTGLGWSKNMDKEDG